MRKYFTIDQNDKTSVWESSNFPPYPHPPSPPPPNYPKTTHERFSTAPSSLKDFKLDQLLLHEKASIALFLE